ncbi:death domain-associated protein 6-like [Limulus polyphemus]|uniref:Death domain-associated protein 6-like n=1 Tax=Limulus polyphemus TaxID=6850 RepID=A0ABM1C324_LIMPO|nr:death domain-associated protein 6-like [Limulus polyphemus]
MAALAITRAHHEENDSIENGNNLFVVKMAVSYNKAKVPVIVLDSDSEEERIIQYDSTLPAQPKLLIKKEVSKEKANSKKNVEELDTNNKCLEKFIAACTPFMNESKELQILQNLKHLTKHVRTDYLQSSEFLNFIVLQTKKIQTDKKDVFVRIKEVFEELKAYKFKKSVKKQDEQQLSSSSHGNIQNPSHTRVQEISRIVDTNSDSSDTKLSEVSATGSKEKERRKEKHVRKLEKLLEKLHRKIKKLQEKELSIDDLDDDNSAYIEEERFKKRTMKVWNKLCELKGRAYDTGRQTQRKFHYNGSRYEEINRNIEKFINRKKLFPDYHDILGIVKEVNKEDPGLRFLSSQMDTLAREIFQDVGKELKKRRCLDDLDLINSYGDVADDPADLDNDLRSKLEESSNICQKKIDEIIDKYAQEQTEMKLQPEEVPDDVNDDVDVLISESKDEEEDEEEEEDQDEDLEAIEKTVESEEDEDLETMDFSCNAYQKKTLSKDLHDPIGSNNEENSASDKHAGNVLTSLNLIPSKSPIIPCASSDKNGSFPYFDLEVDCEDGDIVDENTEGKILTPSVEMIEHKRKADDLCKNANVKRMCTKNIKTNS